MRSSRRTTRMSSMSVTSSEPSLSVETMSLLSFTKRSRSFSLLLLRVRCSIKSAWKTSAFSSLRLPTWRASCVLSSHRLHRLETLERKSTTCNSNCWPSVSKLRLSQKSLRIPWTITDGESSRVPTQIPGRCSRRSRHSRSVSLRRPRRSLRKM